MVITQHASMMLRGLSTDTKPTTNVLANTLFIETDTRQQYLFDGTSTWNAMGGGSGGGIIYGPTYTIYKDVNDADKVKARNNHTGVVDFTHATDIGNVINSCIGALPSSLILPGSPAGNGDPISHTGGGTIYISNDTQGATSRYDLATKITVNTKHNIQLIQEQGSMIYPTAAFATDVINVVNSQYFTAQNLYIDCYRMASGSGDTIKIEKTGGTDANALPHHSDHAMILGCKLYNAPKSAINIGADCNSPWINNTRVQSWGSPTQNGIWLQYASDAKLHGNQVGGFATASKAAIKIDNCVTAELIGNEVFSSFYGIWVYNSRDVTVADNFLQHFSNHGFILWIDATPTQPYNNIIVSGNRITGCSSTGVPNGFGAATADSIHIYLATGNTVKTFLIQNNICTDDPIASEGHPSNTQRYGIMISTTTGNTYKNCMIANNVCTYNGVGGTQGAIQPPNGTPLTGVSFANNIGREIANIP